MSAYTTPSAWSAQAWSAPGSPAALPTPVHARVAASPTATATAAGAGAAGATYAKNDEILVSAASLVEILSSDAHGGPLESVIATKARVRRRDLHDENVDENIRNAARTTSTAVATKKRSSASTALAPAPASPCWRSAIVVGNSYKKDKDTHILVVRTDGGGVYRVNAEICTRGKTLTRRLPRHVFFSRFRQLLDTITSPREEEEGHEETAFRACADALCGRRHRCRRRRRGTHHCDSDERALCVLGQSTVFLPVAVFAQLQALASLRSRGDVRRHALALRLLRRWRCRADTSLSVTLIQALWRGRTARQRYAFAFAGPGTASWTSAVRLQALWRGHKAREGFYTRLLQVYPDGTSVLHERLRKCHQILACAIQVRDVDACVRHCARVDSLHLRIARMHGMAWLDQVCSGADCEAVADHAHVCGTLRNLVAQNDFDTLGHAIEREHEKIRAFHESCFDGSTATAGRTLAPGNDNTNSAVPVSDGGNDPPHSNGQPRLTFSDIELLIRECKLEIREATEAHDFDLFGELNAKLETLYRLRSARLDQNLSFSDVVSVPADALPRDEEAALRDELRATRQRVMAMRSLRSEVGDGGGSTASLYHRHHHHNQSRLSPEALRMHNHNSNLRSPVYEDARSDAPSLMSSVSQWNRHGNVAGPMFVFKILDARGGVKRFQASATSLANLEQRVARKAGLVATFSTPASATATLPIPRLNLSYLDEDGERVHLRSDEDLQDAVETASEKYLRVEYEPAKQRAGDSDSDLSSSGSSSVSSSDSGSSTESSSGSDSESSSDDENNSDVVRDLAGSGNDANGSLSGGNGSSDSEDDNGKSSPPSARLRLITRVAVPTPRSVASTSSASSSDDDSSDDDAEADTMVPAARSRSTRSHRMPVAVRSEPMGVPQAERVAAATHDTACAADEHGQAEEVDTTMILGAVVLASALAGIGCFFLKGKR